MQSGGCHHSGSHFPLNLTVSYLPCTALVDGNLILFALTIAKKVLSFHDI